MLKETIQSHQMCNMPHVPAMIPNVIPDPASIKGKVFLAGGDPVDLLVDCVFCLIKNGYCVLILSTVSVRAKIT
jgi:hypothetical protein